MVHAAVVDGVDGGEVLEHVVVGGERRRRYGRAEKGNSMMPSVKYRVRECESRDHFWEGRHSVKAFRQNCSFQMWHSENISQLDMGTQKPNIYE